MSSKSNIDEDTGIAKHTISPSSTIPLESIIQSAELLKSAETVVTTLRGDKYQEKRNDDGVFVQSHILKVAEERLPVTPTSVPSDYDLSLCTFGDTVLNGSIDGANFIIAEPNVEWTGQVLIYAHGYNPPGHGLIPELDYKGGNTICDCYKSLMSKGWIVAATSYRREGVIIKDAIQDIKNLRNFIAKRYSALWHKQPSLVILEGQSMGGAICTRIAEREPILFNAVLGVGAALLTRKDKQTSEDMEVPLLYAPKIPILYLTNESELGPITQYIDKVIEGDDPDLVIPAIWTVSRPGHNWTNNLERLAGIEDLVLWCKAYDINITRKYNMTHIATCPPSVITWEADGSSGIGVVTSVDLDGGMYTSFTEDDMMVLGIKRYGQTFNVTVNEKTFSVVYDTYPFVMSKVGEVVAFTEPEGRYICVAIFDVFRHHSVAERAGRAKEKDRIQFHKPIIKVPGKLIIRRDTSDTLSGNKPTSLLGEMNSIFKKGLL